eukprot:CAMPEP_0197595724 /NCGR_PEP_ID=MMETSP1326-20131121/23575_1 /TAXON_ID=1155430 /ORGANISM="Genus nov. species nov., Strain RCC2288" /LENGTH=137 /DNA_ID=CAMNT_0043162121 /DNA_START=121 /DNA_END=530 /DNA_ORIENTATION=+
MAGVLTSSASGNTDNGSQGLRIRQWLLKAGLIRYWDRFSGVTDNQFGGLMMQDYAKFGVVDMADKQKLFRLIKTLNSENQFGLKPEPPLAGDVSEAVATPPPMELRPRTPQGSGLGGGFGLSPLLVSPMDEDLLSEA